MLLSITTHILGEDEAVEEEALGVALDHHTNSWRDEAVEEALGVALTTQIPIRSRAGSNMTGKDNRKIHPVPGPFIIRMSSVLLAGRGKQSRLRLYMSFFLCVFLSRFFLPFDGRFGWLYTSYVKHKKDVYSKLGSKVITLPAFAHMGSVFFAGEKNNLKNNLGSS